MFHDANAHAEARAAAVHNELSESFANLEKTASSWFDNTSDSVINRQVELHRVADLCRRAALSFDDESDQAEILGAADSLKAQAGKLQGLVEDLKNEEYESRVGFNGAPVFSSLGISDAPTNSRVDWDLFLSTEPRFFVADNHTAVRDAEEMRVRAYHAITEKVSGRGLNRQAKQDIAAQFLANVEGEREYAANQQKRKTTASTATESDWPDSALFL